MAAQLLRSAFDRAPPRAAAAVVHPHTPVVVHCSSAGLTQPVRIHSRTLALSRGVAYIRTRTWAQRTGLFRIGHNWALRMRLVRIHRGLRTRLFDIHCEALRKRLLH